MASQFNVQQHTGKKQYCYSASIHQTEVMTGEYM